MNPNLKSRLAAVVIGPTAARETSTVEQTMFRGMTAVGAMVTLVIAPVSLLLQRPAAVAIACLVSGLLMLTIHLAARRGRYLLKTTFAMAVATTAIVWFPASGSVGSAPLYQGSTLIYAIVMFRGRARVLSVTTLVAVNLVLLAIEAVHPEYVQPFRDSVAQGIEVGVGVVMSTVLGSLILGSVVTAYDQERVRLRASVAALQSSREQWRQLFDLNPDAVCVVDGHHGQILEVNRGFEELFGWDRAEVDAVPIPDTSLWEDAAYRTALLEILSERNAVRTFVSRGRRRDGSPFWASVSASWLHTPQARHLLLAFRDVGDQMKARQALAESRATLTALVNSTNDMVWLVEPEAFALTQFNGAFAGYCERDLGVTAREGTLPAEMFGADAATWQQYYATALSGGAFNVEHVNANLRILWLSFSPVRLGETVLGVSAFSRDITELRARELARADVERQTLQSQKMESLGRLAGGVAHDFNNMLTAIAGFAHLLQLTESQPDRREQLAAIIQAAARSSELTRKLLAFGRRGKNVVEPVLLSTIVRDCLVMLTPSLGPDVRVELALGDTWTVDGDPSQITQAVLNLCINAHEALPAGGGVIRVSTADQPFGMDGAPGGQTVQLVVTDTGVGMSDDVRARAFEPFFTTKAAAEPSGTGLGLATVDGAVHLHGGRISVESTPGRGSTFTVLLPRGRTTAPASPAAVPAGRGSGLVLVVDDEELVRGLLSSALRSLGFDTVTARDGVEGAAAFEARHAELTGVVLDLRMPRMNGADAFAAMRRVDPSVPVLLCSGYGDNEEAQRLIQDGAIGLLPKPFTIDQLAASLRAMRRAQAS
jgi:PAS domain S-box-containing protein